MSDGPDPFAAAIDAAGMPTPLDEATARLRKVASRPEVGRAARTELALIADDLTAMSYTADMVTKVDDLGTVVGALADQVDALGGKIDGVTAAQVATAQVIGAAAPHIAAIHTDWQAIKSEGIRRFLKAARKATPGSTPG